MDPRILHYGGHFPQVRPLRAFRNFQLVLWSWHGELVLTVRRTSRSLKWRPEVDVLSSTRISTSHAPRFTWSVEVFAAGSRLTSKECSANTVTLAEPSDAIRNASSAWVSQWQGPRQLISRMPI
jgi:hypothetical protein